MAMIGTERLSSALADRYRIERELGAYDLAAEAETLHFSSARFWDPAHAGMRGTPAFKRIVARIGIPAYWREHGYPPQCRPVGTDFECDR